ncbi:hypothetical protein HDU91_002809 [Kappamyces sp. JEL0680]|nr:hypothetical protein HDU91_002809 [Kappamyces sp. JEL0680]
MLERVVEALVHLQKLYGVGFATASACLAMISPNVAFMSDEGLEELVLLPTKTKLTYTVKDYKRLYLALAEKAVQLNSEPVPSDAVASKKRKARDLDGSSSPLEPEAPAQSADAQTLVTTWNVRNVHDAIWAVLIVAKNRNLRAAKTQSDHNRKLKSKEPKKTRNNYLDE